MMAIDQGIVNKVNRKCIEELTNAPELLTSFIEDIQTGTHKKWNMWQIHLGQILAEHFKGRPEKTYMHRPKGNAQMKIGTCYVAEKTGLKFTPQLPLDKCRNDKEKAKMILASNCIPQVKVDLLSVLRF